MTKEPIQTYQEILKEVEQVQKTLGIGRSLDDRITKVKAANYQYASRGDTKMFIDEIERLRKIMNQKNKYS